MPSTHIPFHRLWRWPFYSSERPYLHLREKDTHTHTHTHSTWPLYHFRLFTHFFCHFCPCPSFSCGCSGADRRFPTSRRASFKGPLWARRQRGLPLNHPFSWGGYVIQAPARLWCRPLPSELIKDAHSRRLIWPDPFHVCVWLCMTVIFQYCCVMIFISNVSEFDYSASYGLVVGTAVCCCVILQTFLYVTQQSSPTKIACLP